MRAEEIMKIHIKDLYKETGVMCNENNSCLPISVVVIPRLLKLLKTEKKKELLGLEDLDHYKQGT